MHYIYGTAFHTIALIAQVACNFKVKTRFENVPKCVLCASVEAKEIWPFEQKISHVQCHKFN